MSSHRLREKPKTEIEIMSDQKNLTSQGQAVDPASTCSVSRAFIVRVAGWPAGNCVVMATSAAKAKYQAWASAKEAGYKITFGMLNVRRLPDWDNGGLLAGRCYAEDYVNTL
jgi:hypothetical protein